MVTQVATGGAAFPFLQGANDSYLTTTGLQEERRRNKHSEQVQDKQLQLQQAAIDERADAAAEHLKGVMAANRLKDQLEQQKAAHALDQDNASRSEILAESQGLGVEEPDPNHPAGDSGTQAMRIHPGVSHETAGALKELQRGLKDSQLKPLDARLALTRIAGQIKAQELQQKRKEVADQISHDLPLLAEDPEAIKSFQQVTKALYNGTGDPDQALMLFKAKQMQHAGQTAKVLSHQQAAQDVLTMTPPDNRALSAADKSKLIAISTAVAKGVLDPEAAHAQAWELVSKNPNETIKLPTGHEVFDPQNALKQGGDVSAMPDALKAQLESAAHDEALRQIKVEGTQGMAASDVRARVDELQAAALQRIYRTYGWKEAAPAAEPQPSESKITDPSAYVLKTTDDPQAIVDQLSSQGIKPSDLSQVAQDRLKKMIQDSKSKAESKPTRPLEGALGDQLFGFG